MRQIVGEIEIKDGDKSVKVYVDDSIEYYVSTLKLLVKAGNDGIERPVGIVEIGKGKKMKRRYMSLDEIVSNVPWRLEHRDGDEFNCRSNNIRITDPYDMLNDDGVMSDEHGKFHIIRDQRKWYEKIFVFPKMKKYLEEKMNLVTMEDFESCTCPNKGGVH